MTSTAPEYRLRLAALLALSILTALIAQAQTPGSKSGKVALYASVGPELTHYQMDVGSGALVRRDPVTVPDNVQYAWPHPSRRYLYVAWSNGSGADHHGVSAFRIDGSGVLHSIGKPVSLTAR